MFENVYRFLLKLYPSRFRAEYGDAMLQLFHDRLGAERGALARARLWMDLIWDLTASLPREYRRKQECDPAPGAYRLSEDAVRQMSASGETVATVIAFSFGLALGILGDAPRWPLAAAYSLFGATIPFSAQMRRRMRRRWRGYELQLDGERIEVRQRGAVTVTLHRAEITRMAESPGGHGFPGGLVIRGCGNREIWAPSVLTGYEELRARLAAWATIEPLPARGGRGSTSARLGHFSAFFSCSSLYIAAMLVRSPWVFFPLAALIGAPLSYATARMIPAKGVPAFAKAIPALFLALLLAKLALFAH